MKESDEQLQEQPPRARIPKMAAEKALPQSGAETLVKIIKGYAVASNGGETQINYKDVASAANLHPTIVSRNNSFLAESGILTSPKYGYYVPSEGAVRFAREAAWDEAAAKGHLRKILLNCWYGQVVVQNFTLHSALRREDLKRTLAIKCGATEGDSAALDFLIDFIAYAGLVESNENGTLSRGNFDELAKTRPPTVPVQALAPQTANIIGVAPIELQRAPSAAPPVSFVVHLHVNSLQELTPEYAKQVKDWAKGLQEQGLQCDISVDVNNNVSTPQS